VLLSSVAAGGPVTYYDNRYPIGYNPAPGYFQANFGPGVVTPSDVLSDRRNSSMPRKTFMPPTANTR